jgi:hypothetical protein
MFIRIFVILNLIKYKLFKLVAHITSEKTKNTSNPAMYEQVWFTMLYKKK